LKTFFHDDPVEKLADAQGKPFFVTVRMAAPEEIQERRKSGKIKGQEQLEELRKQVVNEGLTYQEQFEIERKSNVEVMVELARRWEELAESDLTDVEKFFECQGYLLYRHLWKDLDADPKGLRGLCEFFGSPYFGNLPLTYMRGR
jgi:hypothetical protein